MLQNAYNKYGIESLEFGVVEKFLVGTQDAQTKESLSLLEQKYIKEFDSKENGFNLTDGGEIIPSYTISEEKRKYVGSLNRARITGTKLPEEIKKKMSLSHKGKEKSKEHRQHLSEALKGKPKSEEHRLKCKIANQGSKQKNSKV